MRYRDRIFFVGFLLSAAVSAPLANTATPVNPAPAAVLSTARQEYGDAMKAINAGRWTEYEQLRPTLDEYPLAIYLDYYQLSRQAYKVRPADARRFRSWRPGQP